MKTFAAAAAAAAAAARHFPTPKKGTVPRPYDPRNRPSKSARLGPGHRKLRLARTSAALALAAETLLELLDPACGVDKALLTREKRMALGADADLQVFDGRTRLVDCSTGAGDCRCDVVGMNFFFHGLTSLC